jgi:hypothetical protein
MKRFFGWLFLAFAVAMLHGSHPHRDEPDFSSRSFSFRISPISGSGIKAAAPFVIRGAWHLSSNDPAFGGISGLSVDSGHFTAVSDAGMLLQFRPDFRAKTGKGGVTGLPRDCGITSEKTSRDSEALIVDPVTKAIWISFEWRNAICRLGDGSKPAVMLAKPRVMRGWPRTGGGESMARMPDGRFLVIAERPARDGPVSPALIFDRDPIDPAAQVDAFSYRPSSGTRPTDVAFLPDGHMLVVTRSFRPPFSMPGQMELAGPPMVGAEMSGKPVITMTSPMDQNFEAISVVVSQGRTFIWAMTDDNFMPFQRTLLVLIEYAPGTKAGAGN